MAKRKLHPDTARLDFPEFLYQDKTQFLLDYLIKESSKPDEQQENRFGEILHHMDEKYTLPGRKWKKKSSEKINPKTLTELLRRLVQNGFVTLKKMNKKSRWVRYLINPELKGQILPFSVMMSDRYALSRYQQTEIMHFPQANFYGLNPNAFSPSTKEDERTLNPTHAARQMHWHGVRLRDLFTQYKPKKLNVIMPEGFIPKETTNRKVNEFLLKMGKLVEEFGFQSDGVQLSDELSEGVIPSVKKILNRTMEIKMEFREKELGENFTKQLPKADASIYSFLKKHREWLIYVLNSNDWDEESLLDVLNRPSTGFRTENFDSKKLMEIGRDPTLSEEEKRKRQKEEVFDKQWTVSTYRDRDVPPNFRADLKEFDKEKKKHIADFLLNVFWNCKTAPTKISIVAHSSRGITVMDEAELEWAKKINAIPKAKETSK